MRRGDAQVGGLAGVGAVARIELVRIARDRLGLFFIVVLPVLVIVVIGASIGSSGGPARVGVVDLDGSEASARLIAELEASPRLEVVALDSDEALAVDVRLDRLRAGLVLPAGYEAQLAAGRPVELAMAIDPSRTSSTAARASIATVVDRHGAVVAAAAFAAAETGVEPAEAARLAEAATAELDAVGVRTERLSSGGLDAGSPYSYPAAANLVLFTFINTLTVAAVIVESRRLGVTRRILAGPVSPGTVVAGYAASRFAVALFQGTLVVVAGALLFGVRWGAPMAAAALLVAFSIVAAAVGVLMGAVARTPEQAQSIGIPVGIAMGMLGGALWPLEFVPDWLRQLGHLTPHAWAMDGWVTVIFRDGGLTDIALELGVLVAFGAAATALGARALRRAIVSG